MRIQTYIANFVYEIQGFFVKDIRFEKDEIFVSVSPRRKTADCPFCKKRSSSIHQYLKERKILHKLESHYKIFLIGRKRRFHCKHCSRVFTEDWPMLNKWSRKTIKAEEEILASLRDHSFNHLEETWGITDGIARRILNRVELEPSWEEESRQKQIRLGIDEHSFRGRNFVITVTNLSKHKVKTILPDDQQETLKRFLRKIPNNIKAKIGEVCIDMKAAFAEAVKETLIHSSLVVDHFHVIQDANRRLDETRRLEQEAFKKVIKKLPFMRGIERLNEKERSLLQFYFTKYPLLKDWHWGKEQLRALYKSKTREDAEIRLTNIIASFEEHDDSAMNDWGRTLRRWKEPILNYFKNKTTNAYTEGAHTKIKLTKRLSYGFKNVGTYIRKMLLAFIPIALIPFINFHHTF
jgi:transposase